MTGKFGYFFLGAVFLISMRNVFINGSLGFFIICLLDLFFLITGDELNNYFSQGFDGEDIELREQSHFTNIKPKGFIGKNLPAIRFMYCVSCGYKQAFDQFSQFVREKYPDMLIDGSNYPPAPWKAYLAQVYAFYFHFLFIMPFILYKISQLQVISIAKMIAIVVVVTGSNPLAALGFAHPAILHWAQGNKLSACMMLFLLTNMIESTLMSTGAFEIYLDSELLWSKLESGRIPTPQELVQATPQVSTTICYVSGNAYVYYVLASYWRID
uniref:SelT-like protein n=1 Tax=Heterorhabditis bacteriophora TaxID=37862 RepID=A0A1I7XVQ8_HETBA